MEYLLCLSLTLNPVTLSIEELIELLYEIIET